jgi:hypothetical protein
VPQLKPGLTRDEAREDVIALDTWTPLAPDMALLEAGWAEQDRYGLSFLDAMIVAAARRLGCVILLTEDLQDGQIWVAWSCATPSPHRRADASGSKARRRHRARSRPKPGTWRTVGSHVH